MPLGAAQFSGTHTNPLGERRFSSSVTGSVGIPAGAAQFSGTHTNPLGTSRTATANSRVGIPAGPAQFNAVHTNPLGDQRTTTAPTATAETPRPGAPIPAPAQPSVILVAGSLTINAAEFQVTAGADTSQVRIYLEEVELHIQRGLQEGSVFTYTHTGGRNERSLFTFVPFNGSLRGPEVTVPVPLLLPAPSFRVLPLSPDTVLLESDDSDPEIDDIVVQITPVNSDPNLPPRLVSLRTLETPYRPTIYGTDIDPDGTNPGDSPPGQAPGPAIVQRTPARRSAVVSGLPTVPHRFRASSITVRGAGGSIVEVTETPADNPLNRQTLAGAEAALGVELSRISPYHTAELDDFEEAAMHLIPPGLNDDWDSNNGRFARLIGNSMRNINERLRRMVEELFPATASADSLSEHEALVFNTDDPDYQAPDSVPARREALIFRHRTESGASEEFFRNAVKAYGVVGPNVRSVYPARVDEARVSQPTTPSPDRVGDAHIVIGYDRDGLLTEQTHAQMISLLRPLAPTHIQVYAPNFPKFVNPKTYHLDVRDAPVPLFGSEPGTLVGVRDDNGNFVDGTFIFNGATYALSSSGLVNTSNLLDNFIAWGAINPADLFSPVRIPVVVSVSINGILTDITIPIQGLGFASQRGTQGPLLSIPFQQPTSTGAMRII